MTELHYLSAVDALRLFRASELSPVELMEAVIARADAVDPAINAFGERFPDEALAAARRAQERYAGRGPRPRALEGLPVAIKEETAVRGQRTTFGSLIYKDEVAVHTAPVVERILRAGGIVHARTTAPEFSCAPYTQSRLWGVTRNPWNLDCSPGGSSGGAGASLAAGTTTLANGSDIAGSIRIPASACGVIGFKPPYGRVPGDAPFNLDHYCHDGPMARTVADCALFENVLAGPHKADVATVRPKLRIPAELAGIKGWRIALSPDLDGCDVDRDVAANTARAAEALRDAGAIVEEVELGWDWRKIMQASLAHLGVIFGTYVGREVERHRDLMTPYAIWFAEESASVTPADYVRALELECEVYASLGALLERYRLLVCPTLALPALEAGELYLERTPDVNGMPLEHPYDFMFTLPFNQCSRCPVMSVPSGFASNGVPTGVQLVGRSFDDVSVFRAAAALERATSHWVAEPRRLPTGI